MIEEKLKKDFMENYTNAMKLEELTNKDYENVQKVISESEEIITKRIESYSTVIQGKNDEIESLKKQLNQLDIDTMNIKKQLYMIPVAIRNIYNK